MGNPIRGMIAPNPYRGRARESSNDAALQRIMGLQKQQTGSGAAEEACDEETGCPQRRAYS